MLDSQRMENTWRLAVIDPRRFTIRRRVPRQCTIDCCETLTSQLTFDCSVLVDKAASKNGDLYIRSVCFSPDGKYLATGAEDKKIRVRHFSQLSFGPY